MVAYAGTIKSKSVTHGKNGWTRRFPHVEEVWGKSAIQKEKFKAAQIYANLVARQALELLDRMEENISPASISAQLAASALKGVSIEKKPSIEKI